MNVVPFGRLADGTAVEQYTLRAGALSCEILTYGGALRALRVPDRDGAPVDVLLGFDTLEGYLAQDKYMGALVGRYANRIGGASFPLEGRTIRLAANDGPNHLHGGGIGFDKRVWTVEEAGEDRLVLSLVSPDGQEGYPGTLSVRVTYTLAAEGLTIGYRAETDRITVCSLTSHGYFDLAGGGRSIEDHLLQIFGARYTPADEGSIPTGEISPVAGTVMDFRTAERIGARIGADFPQLRQAGGYDHNWVVDGPAGTLRPAARASSGVTGIAMEVRTTLPGLQFYSGNYLEGCPTGKGGARYGDRSGFCLEAQMFPDSPHHPEFPSCVLRPGEVWDHTTQYLFAHT